MTTVKRRATEIPYNAPVRATVNGIHLAYDSFGDADGYPMLLIAGQGTGMLAWGRPFCTTLAGHGFRVIRFDNRDVGLSTKFSDSRPPGLFRLFISYIRQRPAAPPYTLMDMMDDTVELLDALHVETAHLVGRSLGGMIAQMVAIHHPDRVRTLTLMMSSTGSRRLPRPELRMLKLLLHPIPTDRDRYIAHVIEVQRLLSGSRYPPDEESLREYAATAYERDHEMGGAVRQLMAVISCPDREEQLRHLSVPTLVIHGRDDPLLPVAHGIRLAEVIPGARLWILEGVGHELPPPLWQPVAEAIAHHALQAEG